MRAAVFNNHLQTFGGGERVTYAAATALAQMGIETEVLTTERLVPSLSDVSRFFGPELHGFAIKRVEDRADLVRTLARSDIFVNHTAGDETPNPCRVGLYFVMFPFQERSGFLGTYHRFLCNSEFTARHTNARWNAASRTQVLYPPVTLAEGVPTKRKQIISLGRFNRAGHDKNQASLISCFERLVALGHKDWKLLLVGKNNSDDLISHLRARIGSLPVELHLDVDEATKNALLARSSIFWHGAGLGVDEATDPERLEHFGIAVPEAMSAGLVPFVYYRGGPAEIVRHGGSGFHFRNADELVTLTHLIATNETLQRTVRAGAIERAADFGPNAFQIGFSGLVRQLLERRS